MSTKRGVQGRSKLGRNPLTLKAVSQNELSYLAGYIDGEGCLLVAAGSITIKVDSCYPKICYRLFKLFGGRFRQIQRKFSLKSTTRNYFSWAIHGQKAFMAVTLLFPFLREKKDQAKLLLKAHHTKNTIEKNKIALKIKELKRIVYI